MPIRINSWNCCLGISKKIETIKTVISEYKSDILFIQEAEITNQTPIDLLKVDGYITELSPTFGQKKSRTLCYVKCNLKYTRLTEQENNKIEMIILRVNDAVICGYYRPFLLPNHNSELEYVEDSCKAIEALNFPKMIWIGDFNIDFGKISLQNFNRSVIFNRLEETLIEKTFVQLIKRPTWQ